MKLSIILIHIIQGLAALGVTWGSFSIFMSMLSRHMKSPKNLGITDGKLASCPNMQNCVSSQSEDHRHAINPISYVTSAEQAQATLVEIIHSTERTEVISEEPGYIYAEFRSKGMGYVDDVEFFFDPEEHVIHFRSSARLPYFDWGVNRKRMELIRNVFMTAESSSH